MKTVFRKRTFTLPGFIYSFTVANLFIPRTLIALIKPSTSRALREQVMLASTSVNGCRYCDWLHTTLALKNEVDVNELNQLLGNGEESQIPRKDAVAILFGQHFAEKKTWATREAKNRLKEEFNFWQRTEIYAYLYSIYLGNLSGNTFDALLARIKGHKVEGSNVITEILVSIIAAPILLLIMATAKDDKKVGFEAL